jgi:hypothetical protein
MLLDSSFVWNMSAEEVEGLLRVKHRDVYDVLAEEMITLLYEIRGDDVRVQVTLQVNNLGGHQPIPA